MSSTRDHLQATGAHPRRQAVPDARAALDEVVAYVEARLGVDLDDPCAGVATCDWLSLQRFAEACGDENPLYVDPSYGAGSWWQTTIAPPAFVLAARAPDFSGRPEDPFLPPEYEARLVSIELAWSNHALLGERLAGSVCVRAPRVVGDVVLVDSSAAYASGGTSWAIAHGTVAVRPRAGEAPAGRLDVERYDDDAIALLVETLDAEPARRGAVPRRWEQVQVGDALPTQTKGPLTWSDIVNWLIAEGRMVRAANLRQCDLVADPTASIAHPVTRWPHWDRTDVEEDHIARAAAGLGPPRARPALAVALCSQVITDWMGDDAFLRWLRVDLHEPLRYGDVWRIGGHVRRKAVQLHSGRRHGAVVLELRGVDQRGRLVADGLALALLPSAAGPVELPIAGVGARRSAEA